MRVRPPNPRQANFWLAIIGGLVLTLTLPNRLISGTPALQQQSRFATSGSPARGKQLFTGQSAFQNGGPPCSACHSISVLAFPNGGTLGPDLTHAYTKLGPEGMDAALETLYFPAMAPLYDPHPLTIPEQADLKTFLQQAAIQPPAPEITLSIAVIALAGFAVLILLTWFVWRKRATGVRKALLARTMKSGGIPL